MYSHPFAAAARGRLSLDLHCTHTADVRTDRGPRVCSRPPRPATRSPTGHTGIRLGSSAWRATHPFTHLGRPPPPIRARGGEAGMHADHRHGPHHRRSEGQRGCIGGIVRIAAASMDAAHARGVGLLLELTLVEGGSSNQIASCQCPDCCAALPPPPLLTATLWLRLMRPEGRPKAGSRPYKPGTGLYAALQPRSVTQRAECIEGRQRRHSRAHRTCPRRAS